MFKTMDLRGLWAHFAIRDVTFPNPDTVLRALHEHDIIAGEVVDVSDAADTETAFVVVNVAGLEQPVVVPVARVRLTPRGST